MFSGVTMTDLSLHFTVEEGMASETAARYGIDNTPPAHALVGMRQLCTLILEPVRDRFGSVHVNSMFRCLTLNRRIGSSDNSQHIASANWAAADITVKTATPLQVCHWLAESGLPFDQLIHEYGAWTHVSWSTSPRGMLLTIDREGKRPGLHPAR